MNEQAQESGSPRSANVETSGEMLSIDAVRNPLLKKGVEYWRSLCGERKFPARSEMTLRGMAAILPYAVIVGVIDRGADYEYKYVGDAQRQAFKAYFKGLRVSQIEATAPELGATLRSAYEQVRSLGLPFVVSGRYNPDPSDSKPYYECTFLPLGTNDVVVDHLLIIGVQIPSPFWELPAEKLAHFQNQSLVSSGG